MEETSLKEEIKRLREATEEVLEVSKKKKEKKFKIPSKARVNTSKARKNFVTVMKVNENGHVDFSRHQITEGSLIIDGIPKISTTDYMLYYKKNPLIILPSWSLKPFSPVEHYEDIEKQRMNAAGMKLILNKIEQGEIKQKGQISGKIIFGAIIVLIIVVYFLFFS